MEKSFTGQRKCNKLSKFDLVKNCITTVRNTWSTKPNKFKTIKFKH